MGRTGITHRSIGSSFLFEKQMKGIGSGGMCQQQQTTTTNNNDTVIIKSNRIILYLKSCYTISLHEEFLLGPEHNCIISIVSAFGQRSVWLSATHMWSILKKRIIQQ
jgi:hypothetical protein